MILFFLDKKVGTTESRKPESKLRWGNLKGFPRVCLEQSWNPDWLAGV